MYFLYCDQSSFIKDLQKSIRPNVLFNLYHITYSWYSLVNYRFKELDDYLTVQHIPLLFPLTTEPICETSGYFKSSPKVIKVDFVCKRRVWMVLYHLILIINLSLVWPVTNIDSIAMGSSGIKIKKPIT